MRFAPIVPAAMLLLSMWPAPAAVQMTPAFGPKRFTRTTGAPQTFTEEFPHCGSGQQCRLVVVNGSVDGAGRVTRASISLNGSEIFGAGAFSRQAATIARPVALADRNRLTVTLESQAGGFLTVRVECVAPAATVSASDPGVSLVSGNLVTALPFRNTGAAAALNVTASEISVSGGMLASPSVPFDLGTIAAGGSAVLHAAFSGAWQPQSTGTLTVNGRYSVGAATYCFAVASNFLISAGPGSSSVGVTTAAPQTVSSSRYPHQPRTFPDDVNMPRWTVPTVGEIRFRTNPSRLRISVDGGAATATPFSLSLTEGPHTVTAANQPGPAGTRYMFKQWSDNGAATHQINAGADSATYTATFVTQYLLTTSAEPSGGGTISIAPPSPEPGGFYDDGTRVTIAAEPNRWYVFAGFGGALTGTANPRTITLTGPASVVANFLRQ